uniref:DUF4216 domain-containing protein n=1 Tax=Chenopodium quinoa TaxID=63459 RepID=A0A803N216_CHEQI
MHIEKNVLDNILGTLLDIDGKSKDNSKARHDLKYLKVMKHLAPVLKNGKWHIPPALYTLSRAHKEKVMDLPNEGNDQVEKDLKTLALGPLKGVLCFNGILENGFGFHTRDIEMKRVHQNSGVMVKGIVGNTEKDYYGILSDILEIQYLDGKRVVLFRCDWWDINRVGRGVKVDKHGNTHPRHHYNVQEKEVIESDEDALQQLQPMIDEDATEENQPKDFSADEYEQFHDEDLLEDDEDDCETDQESDGDADDDIDLA